MTTPTASPTGAANTSAAGLPTNEPPTAPGWVDDHGGAATHALVLNLHLAAPAGPVDATAPNCPRPPAAVHVHYRTGLQVLVVAVFVGHRVGAHQNPWPRRAEAAGPGGRLRLRTAAVGSAARSDGITSAGQCSPGFNPARSWRSSAQSTRLVARCQQEGQLQSITRSPSGDR